MKTRSLFPFNIVVVHDYSVSLKKALECGRIQAAFQGGSPVKLAALFRKRIIAKPKLPK
jgi:hypothetical protein